MDPTDRRPPRKVVDLAAEAFRRRTAPRLRELGEQVSRPDLEFVPYPEDRFLRFERAWLAGGPAPWFQTVVEFATEPAGEGWSLAQEFALVGWEPRVQHGRFWAVSELVRGAAEDLFARRHETATAQDFGPFAPDPSDRAVGFWQGKRFRIELTDGKAAAAPFNDEEMAAALAVHDRIARAEAIRRSGGVVVDLGAPRATPAEEE